MFLIHLVWMNWGGLRQSINQSWHLIRHEWIPRTKLSTSTAEEDQSCSPTRAFGWSLDWLIRMIISACLFTFFEFFRTILQFVQKTLHFFARKGSITVSSLLVTKSTSLQAGFVVVHQKKESAEKKYGATDGGSRHSASRHLSLET